MNRFDNGPKTAIVIGEREYNLNVAYDGCCLIWDGRDAMEAGLLSQEGYCALIIETMYHDPKPDIWSQEALQFACDYLNYYSDKDSDERTTLIPPISIRQDWPMIVSSLLPMGIDLRTDMIDYGKFMFLLRNLPEGCEYANIMRLRRQYYEDQGKMKQDERKRLNEDIRRVGRNRVIIQNRRMKQETADYEDEIARRQNEARAKKGLPPL